MLNTLTTQQLQSIINTIKSDNDIVRALRLYRDGWSLQHVKVNVPRLDADQLLALFEWAAMQREADRLQAIADHARARLPHFPIRILRRVGTTDDGVELLQQED